MSGDAPREPPVATTPAEGKILAEFQSGLDIFVVKPIADPEAPSGFRIPVPEPDAPYEVRVRASFVRRVFLGEAGRLHERGLRIHGALIVSDGPEGAATRGLDLESCSVERDLALGGCLFDEPIFLRSAELRNLILDGSVLTGISADGIIVRGGVFLRAAQFHDEVRLLGARLGGDLSCVGATFCAAGGRALNADGLHAQGSVILRAAQARGEICRPAEFHGEVRLLGAQIGGDLDCVGAMFRNPEGKALNADAARIDGTFFLRRGAKIEGELDLTGAKIGAICDDPDSWPKQPGDLLLDRCRYGAFLGAGVDADTRIAWLAKQDPAQFGKDFWPQPWEQCAKVFREMGHGGDARAILIEKERLQRRARRARHSRPLAALYWLADGLLGITVRYGRQPLLAFAWLFGFWVLGVGIFHDAEAYSAIKPNNAFILRSDEWASCAYPRGEQVFDQFLGVGGVGRADRGESQLECFLAQPEAANFPDFDPWIYSLDTLLPVVDMEMQAFWIPDEKAEWESSAATRRYLWFHIAVGWALSLLAVAGFSGLVKSD